MNESRTVAGPDARILKYCCWGPPDAPAVFWLHGTPGSRISRHRDELYQKANVRVVTYDRPGYGGSDRRPGRHIVDTAADVSCIADALGLRQFAVAGVSGGGPHALAVAAKCRMRVTRCATVTGLGPYCVPDLDFLAGMPADEQDVWRMAQQDSPELEFKLLPTLESWRERLRNEMLTEQPSDHWAKRNLVKALDEAWVQGPTGIIDDYIALTRPWGFDVSQIEAQTMVMVAKEDREIPPAHGEWLAGNIANALSVEVFGGHFGPRETEEGRLLMWLSGSGDARPEPIIRDQRHTDETESSRLP